MNKVSVGVETCGCREMRGCEELKKLLLPQDVLIHVNVSLTV